MSVSFETVFIDESCIFTSLFESDEAFDSTFDQYVSGTNEYYNGSYDITPLITAQTMAVKEKTMRDDVLIRMIPTREVLNAAGGVSFIIGG
jgi:hypothetical protein